MVSLSMSQTHCQTNLLSQLWSHETANSFSNSQAPKLHAQVQNIVVITIVIIRSSFEGEWCRLQTSLIFSL